ncbi:glycosyltransferase family 4 protein [Calidithermus timidus]|jgi:glycosyltransferase involved in cell wall biosynthesis|uniref:glycosyltransferase family 4 protein n=1 Tax=Calidithermus timidus TaxID=307124 RepID=UPI000379887F|nr:glycosyltransferase family 1 protein [Calidithermus timidus]
MELTLAVPKLETYSPQSGIGRVLSNLRAGWGERVRVVGAAYRSLPLPLLRNRPIGVRLEQPADLVLLPQLTGAEALRDTGGLPGVVIVHDIGVVDFPGDRGTLGWWSHESVKASFYALRRASRVIAVSEFTRGRLLHHLPQLEGRVEVVLNGVDPTFLEPGPTPEQARERLSDHLGRELRGALVLYVGTELPRKNLGLLLRAFARTRKDFPEAVLLKVGGAGGPRWREQTQALLRELALREGQDVLFLQGVDDAMLRLAYSAADAVALPSLYEGFGLPALEALACGTQVLVTDCAALPEAVGRVGVVVEPQLEAFAAALGRLLATPPTQEWRQAARDHACQLAWPSRAEAYLDIIRRVAGRA